MESRELLDELYTLGDSLKLVGIPNDAETAILMEFAQKLNRLIGGTASIGFEGFARLSRKTSLLATKCGEIKGMTLRIIIKNLNLVISVLSNCFNDLESIKAAEEKIPDIELKIDICMTSIGIEEPELKTQEQIDEMFDEMKKEKPETPLLLFPYNYFFTIYSKDVSPPSHSRYRNTQHGSRSE